MTGILLGAELAVFGVSTGISIIPFLQDMFGPKPPSNSELSIVRIGIGNTNETTGQVLGGGPLPQVTLYDVNGQITGDNKGDGLPLNKAGEFTELAVKSTITPEYMRVTASGTSNEPICISWVSINTAAGDTRAWNGGFGFKCGVPWYPSSAPLPKTVNVRPPCVWLSKNADVPGRMGFSFRTVDFLPPASGEPGTVPKVKPLAAQWERDPDTLCRAPGRQQFWDIADVRHCVPFFPNPLVFNENGEDADREYLLRGHRQRCREALYVDNRAPLFDIDGNIIADRLTTPGAINPGSDHTPELDKLIEDVKENGGIFSDTITLGPLVGKRSMLGKRRDGMSFVRARSDAHEKCQRELVWHGLADIDVRAVCDSPSAWGADMASDSQRLYCDMCEHEIYPYCDSADQVGCWDSDKFKLRVPEHGKRSDGSSFPASKVWQQIHEW